MLLAKKRVKLVMYMRMLRFITQLCMQPKSASALN